MENTRTVRQMRGGFASEHRAYFSLTNTFTLRTPSLDMWFDQCIDHDNCGTYDGTVNDYDL